MRFLEKCPKCGWQEPANWRPRFIRVEDDIIEAENVPELAAKLTPRVPYTEGQWTYYMTKPRKWIYRTLTAIFKAEGKFPDHRAVKLGLPSGRTAMMQAYNHNIVEKRKQLKLV